MTRRPDDEHLDPYELWARERLEPVLGSLRVIDRKGVPSGVHDFEADLPNGTVAAIEVTSQVESQRLSLAIAAERRFDSLRLPDSSSLWVVSLTAGARVKNISHEQLRRLLSDLEAQGRKSALNFGDYRDRFVERLRELGIESVYRLEAKAGYEGTVLVQPGVYGVWGWDGSAIDAWLANFLASDQGINKLEKLERAIAVERHLVIVLDAFSQAGMGISVGLTAQYERGPAEYARPSLVPPKPLTHLWLLVALRNWGGLRWAHDSGWGVLAAEG